MAMTTSCASELLAAAAWPLNARPRAGEAHISAHVGGGLRGQNRGCRSDNGSRRMLLPRYGEEVGADDFDLIKKMGG